MIAADVRQVDFSPYRGTIDLVYGGPPCQPFSSGGLRRAVADERDMIPEFIRAVREIRPRAVVMENVPGLKAAERSSYLASIIEQFNELGFQTVHAVLNSADFAVPQNRRRLFVVAMTGTSFTFPHTSSGPFGDRRRVAARDVLGNEPNGELNPSKVFYAKNPDLRPGPYDGHLFNGGGRPINLDGPCHTILASAGGNKTHFLDLLGIVPEYHRHLASGGRPYEGELPGARRLTVAESAMIQSFPSWLPFHGPRSAQYHQIGDAVPPLVAKAIGIAITKQLTRRASRTAVPSRFSSRITVS